MVNTNLAINNIYIYIFDSCYSLINSTNLTFKMKYKIIVFYKIIYSLPKYSIF